MAELSQEGAESSVADAVSLRVTRAKAIALLKSWNRDDPAPVMIGGTQLPTAIGAAVRRPCRMLCLRPSEWLIIETTAAGRPLPALFEPRQLPPGFVLIDQTSAMFAIEVSGASARALLAKGTGLDLHPRRFGPGQCARTRFAQIPVVLECLEETGTFELVVTRSYTHYLHSWLLDAALEFSGLHV